MERHHADREYPADEPSEPLAERELPAEERAHERVETAPDPPRVFLSDDGAFAKGVDRGRWLDAASDAEELIAARDELLTTSPFAGGTISIRRHSGFAGLAIAADENLTTVSQLASGIATHGRAFAAYADWLGRDEETLAAFPHAFAGSWPSVTRWAETYVEERGWWDQLSEHVDPQLLPHLRIDFERLGRELTYDHYVVEDNEASQVYVFRLAP